MMHGSQFYQENLTRLQAEHLFQQMYGPIIGIERVTDEQLRKRLPPQFKLAWLAAE
jgi:hypothetical protein